MNVEIPDGAAKLTELIDKLNNNSAAHAAGYGALVILLIDKGVITKEEYDRAYLQCQVDVDQEFARKRDETSAT